MAVVAITIIIRMDGLNKRLKKSLYKPLGLKNWGAAL
jgi:hypothetical protein